MGLAQGFLKTKDITELNAVYPIVRDIFEKTSTLSATEITSNGQIYSLNFDGWREILRYIEANTFSCSKLVDGIKNVSVATPVSRE